MISWLGSDVASWSFLPRMLAYTVAWTVWSLLLEVAIEVFQDAMRWLGLLTNERDRRPTMSTSSLIAINVYAWFVQNIPVGAVLAWYNPTPEKWTFASEWPHLYQYYLPLLAFQVAANLFWDVVYFHVHIFFHQVKWLYRHFHKFHHRTDAMLSVLTTGVLDPLDAWLNAGLEGAVIVYIACFHMNSYLFYALTLHSMWVLQITGHSGSRVNNNDLCGWLHLLLTPTMISQGIVGNAAADVHHAGHHLNPMANFGLYTTFWDDLYGTSKPAYTPHALGLMALDLVYMLVLIAWGIWSLDHTLLALALVAFHLLTPNRAQALLMAPFTAWVPRLAIWDKLRALYLVNYAPKGTPGAFEADPSQRYIFCYHPQNIIARGAWYTFAGVGSKSPLAALPRCRLAIGRLLIMTPGIGPVCRAYGCCSSYWDELKHLLTDRKVPTSVAITPDGFNDGRHVNTYNLVLNKRKGFVRLAHATGAALVPVLGIGEGGKVLRGHYNWLCLGPKLIVPTRAAPIKVVFGTPVVVWPGETVEQTHQRYVAELLALGKAHDVKLTIVE